MPKINKPWGYEELLEHTELPLRNGATSTALKRIFIDGEEMTSAHRHNETHVFLYVVNGLIELQLEDDIVQLETGDSYFIENTVEHQLVNLDSDVAELIEFLLPFTPGDVERENDPYNRE